MHFPLKAENYVGTNYDYYIQADELIEEVAMAKKFCDLAKIVK